jgi:phosphoglycerate dehydrogenase-like enzyme
MNEIQSSGLVWLMLVALLRAASVAIKGRCGELLKKTKSGTMMRIGFIGAGNIAQALAKGFIAAGK